jgi:hypothetical protein
MAKMYVNSIKLEEKAYTVLANKFSGGPTNPTLTFSSMDQQYLLNEEQPSFSTNKNQPPIDDERAVAYDEGRSPEVKSRNFDDISMAMMREYCNSRPVKRLKNHGVSNVVHDETANPLQVRDDFCLNDFDLSSLGKHCGWVNAAHKYFDSQARHCNILELVDSHKAMFQLGYGNTDPRLSQNCTGYSFPWTPYLPRDTGMRTMNPLFYNADPPVLNETLDQAVSDQMETLLHVMGCSEESQKAVEWFNQKMGVNNRSLSMSKTLSSRKKVQELARMHHFV